jgi:hypothetical protein
LLLIDTSIGCTRNDETYRWIVLAPTHVELPYEDDFDKTRLTVEIKAIPNRTDAIHVFVDIEGAQTYVRKAWVQVGTGRVDFPLDGGKAKYLMTFHEFTTHQGTVSGVKLSIGYEQKWSSQ